jgi:hypothetical protein
VRASTIFDRTRTPLTVASAASLHPLVTSNVEPGTRIITNAPHGSFRDE